MRIAVMLPALFIYSVFAQKSMWEELALSESKTFYSLINNNVKYHSFQAILQNFTNKTFFIPSENAVQSAIKNNIFTDNTTLEELLFSVLPETYDIHTLLTTSKKRQYVKTFSTSYPTIILSPPTSSKNIQVLAGTTIANITNHTLCSNGIIYHVDQFITAPLNVISTISSLSELNQLENTIKSQNLSNIFTSSTKQTIFAPIDAAWNAVNGTKVPYGTIVHNLKYHVVEGLYYQQDLVATNLTLITTYSSATIQTESYADGHIAVISGGSSSSSGTSSSRISISSGNSIESNKGSDTSNNNNNTVTIANIVQSDILTSSGKIIHLIDNMLAADPNITSNNTRIINTLAVHQTSFSASTRIFNCFNLFLIITVAVISCFVY